jgi:hypothetical protein
MVKQHGSTFEQEDERLDMKLACDPCDDISRASLKLQLDGGVDEDESTERLGVSRKKSLSCDDFNSSFPRW